MTAVKTKALLLAPEITLEMILIPTGKFKMGNNLRMVYLSEYYIAKHPLTVAEFAVFVRETQYQKTAEKEDGGSEVFNGEEWEYREHVSWGHPRGKWMGGVALKQNHQLRTQVSWDDAAAGAYEGFQSPYGCVDMAINVREFAGTSDNRCIRGVVNNRYQASLADCLQYDKYFYDAGFRVCTSVKEQW